MGLGRWETFPGVLALLGTPAWRVRADRGESGNPLVDFYLTTHCVSTTVGDQPRPFGNGKKEGEE